MDRRGFTLMEVLVALAVVAMLSALALPAVWGRLGDARVNSAARQLEAAVISVRTQAQREGRAIILWAVPGRQGTQLAAERLETGVLAVDEFEEGGSEMARVEGGGGAGRRILSTLPRGVTAGFGLRAAELAGAERGFDEDEGAATPPEPLRLVVALPDGAMIARGPVELVAGGTGLRVRINRYTGVCTVERARRSDAAGQERRVLEDEDAGEER